MEAVDLTGPFSFGDSWLNGGRNEVKICKAAHQGNLLSTSVAPAVFEQLMMRD
jgi:hypothetical protein